MKRKCIFGLLVGLFLFTTSGSIAARQVVYEKLIKVGATAPEFNLRVLSQGVGKAVPKTNKDYKGQWLVLDFWTRGCLTCIQSFPKLEQLRKETNGEFKLILVGRNDVRFNAGIENIYERFRADWFLKMDIAFDTTIFKRYGVTVTPAMVVINPEGKVAYAKVGTTGMSAKFLRNLMAGKEEKPTTDPIVETRPVRVNHDSVSKVPHQSKLLPLNPGHQPTNRPELVQPLETDSFYHSPVDLGRLYLMAYFGRSGWGPIAPLAGHTWEKPILEMADTSAFIAEYGKVPGNYSYMLRMPVGLRKQPEMMQALQADLQLWFPYRASIETRTFPVLELVVLPKVDKKQFRTKTEKLYVKGSPISYTFQNAPMSRFMAVLRNYLSKQVIVDATGIDFPIDLELDANLLEPASVAQALRSLGLDLVPANRPLKVLVIHDR